MAEANATAHISKTHPMTGNPDKIHSRSSTKSHPARGRVQCAWALHHHHRDVDVWEAAQEHRPAGENRPGWSMPNRISLNLLGQPNRPRIFRHHRIIGQKCNPFHQSLRNQQPVELLFMDRRQHVHRNGMHAGNRQFIIPVID